MNLTSELQNLESQRKALQSSQQAAEAQQSRSSPFTGRYEPEGRIEKLSDKRFAVVVLTKCFAENESQFVRFETNLQRIIGDLDRYHPDGWVVDLRGNVGGNMWPMLAGIGPLLGENDHLGEFLT